MVLINLKIVLQELNVLNFMQCSGDRDLIEEFMFNFAQLRIYNLPAAHVMWVPWETEEGRCRQEKRETPDIYGPWVPRGPAVVSV